MSIASVGVAAVLVAGGVLGGVPATDATEQSGEQLGTGSAGAAGDERAIQLQTCDAGDGDTFQGTARVVLSRVGDQVVPSIEGYRITNRYNRSDGNASANMQLYTEERDQDGQVVATRNAKSKDDLHQDGKWRDLGKPISTSSVAVAGHTYWAKVKFTFDRAFASDLECTTAVRIIKNDEIIGTPITQTHTGTVLGKTGTADVVLQRTGDFVTGTLSRYFMTETIGDISYVQLRMEQRDGSTGQVLNRTEKSGESKYLGGWNELTVPVRAEFPAIEGATYHAQVKFTAKVPLGKPDVTIMTEFQDFGTMNDTRGGGQVLPPVNLAASSQVVSREGSTTLTATVPEDATGTITFVETTSGTDRTLTQVPVVNGTAATTYTASSTARGTRTFIAAYTGDGDTRYQDNRSTPITITIH